MFLKDRKIISLAQKDRGFLNALLQSEEAVKFVKHAIKAYTKSPAKFMAVNKVEWEDLMQEANIGLFQAIRKMNLELSPNEWVRYAYLSVQGELRKFSRSNDSNMIVISTRIREMYPKYKKFHEEVWSSTARDPSIEETMSRFFLSRDEAFELVYGMQDIISVENRKAWKRAVRDSLAAIQHKFSRELSVKRQGVEKEATDRIMAELALKCVNEIQRKVIYLHYFRGFSKTEISQAIGCSNSMVSKHLSTAFQNIRKTPAFEF